MARYKVFFVFSSISCFFLPGIVTRAIFKSDNHKYADWWGNIRWWSI